jgi:multidrug efflux system outer membrane protein
MRRLAVLAMLLVLTASCTMGPNYNRPELDTMDSYRDAEAVEAERQSLANTPWWEMFEDPVLRDLINIALEQNKDLLATAWRVEEARAQLGFVKADMWPSFTYAVGAVTTDPGSEFVDFQLDRFEQYNVALGVSWEIDLWGKFRRSNESARAQLFASEWGRQSLIVSLVAEVARAYFLLRDLDERVNISKRTLASRHDSTALIRSRFEGGIVSQLDVHQAEIQEGVAAVAVPQFVRLTTQVENALSVLLGRNPGPLPRGEQLVEQRLPDEFPSELPSDLLQRRPDIRQTEELLHAQLARIGVAQALRWPALTITGAGGLQSNAISNLTSGGFWSIGANLIGPLFQFNKNKRRVEAERARTEQAILEYEATVLDAFREVEDAMIAVSTLRDEYQAVVMQVDAARKAQHLSRARYDGGVTSYLEVLDIERSLFRAELDASRTMQEHLSAIVDLYAGLGGGWGPDTIFVLPESRIVTDPDTTE